MKNIVVLFIVSIYLLGCSSDNSHRDFKPKFLKQYKVLNGDTFCNLISNDSLVYSYFTKNNKANGPFQSYRSGKVFSKGVMIDSLKNGVWRYYNMNSDIDSVIHFYNDIRKFVLDKTDFVFKKSNLAYSGIEMDTPYDWDIRENFEGTLFTLSKKEKENGFKSNITAIRDKKTSLAFEAYCNNVFNLISSQFSNVKIVEKKEMYINGNSAQEFVFTGNVSNNLIGNILIIINHPEGNYIFTAGAGNTVNGDFIKYKGLFEEILYTVKIPYKKV